MSNPTSSKYGPHRKSRPDIYTILLAIALVAVVIGCIFLYLEVADYPDSPPWSGATAAAWVPAFAGMTAWVQPDHSESGPGGPASTDAPTLVRTFQL